ncbi:FecR domain-containing protein [Caulobacter sp. 73W]|uniref:FecR domain-containing protein n=1 Tax=Caulobacter sp. 73W TaxID=3161137 RepID=A0AB39KXH6_9CAUL
MNAIDQEAARWVVRRDGQGWSDVDQAALEAWLEADRRHRGAYLRAQAGWAAMDRASVLAADGRPAPRAQGGLSRRGLLSAGLGGAGIAAAAGVAAVLVTRGQDVIYGTAVGEVREVPLKDGSRLLINTASQVRVDYEAGKRRLRLDAGEAWFEVAKDPKRPFVVASGPVNVTAIGTAFSVRRREAGVEVLVTEGVVSVQPRRRLGAEPLRVAAGQRVLIDPQGMVAQPRYAVAEIDRALAWRSGQIILEGDTLGEAVAEFNRYNARKIVFDDPALAEERLVGWFRTNEPESFAKAAAGMLGLAVVTRDDQIVLQPADLRKNMST